MLKVSEGIWSVCASTYDYRKSATFWTLDRSFFRIGPEKVHLSFPVAQITIAKIL